ncbi:unnamed protein product [Closterium sp. Naga37s-1]|nr:unnamed protein product [Closterium sp. Naga37s-1]
MLGRPVSLAACAAPLTSANNAPAIAVRCAAKDGKAAAEPKSASHGHPGPRVVNRRLILGGLAAGMAAVVGCPICDSNGGSSIGAALAADTSKVDISGPMEWGELCSPGDAAQSATGGPLNAVSKLTKDNSLGNISFAYKNADASFLNTGHGTMQASRSVRPVSSLFPFHLARLSPPLNPSLPFTPPHPPSPALSPPPSPIFTPFFRSPASLPLLPPAGELPGRQQHMRGGRAADAAATVPLPRAQRAFVQRRALPHGGAPRAPHSTSCLPYVPSPLLPTCSRAGDADGKLAVIGVMIEADPRAPRNLCLEAALAFAPGEKKKQIEAPQECLEVAVVGRGGARSALQQCLRVQTSPQPLLPPTDRPDASHAYIHYQGSLADPACSDVVDWFVLAAPLKVPDSQVLESMSYVGDGAACTAPSNSIPSSFPFLFASSPLTAAPLKVPDNQVLEFLSFVGDRRTLAFNSVSPCLCP